MTEEQKELLKEKIKNLFEQKINLLTTKYEKDFNFITEIKYIFFNNIIIPYNELQEMKKEKEKEIEKEKENKKEEKKETIKEPLSKSINKKEYNSKITATPKKQIKKREIEFKGKTEIIPKKFRVFSGKTHKPELATSQVIPEKTQKKTITLTETNKKKENIRTSKTPLNKKEKGKDKEDKKYNKDNKIKKTKAISATAYKPSATKRFTAQKKSIDKKGKPEKKKKDIKKNDNKKKDKNDKDKKEEKAKDLEKKIEKILVLKDKTINKIPDELKNNNTLFNFYLIIKRNYLSNKENFKLILSVPNIYKAFGNNITFLLEDTKKELKSKISEIESFLNRYGDLPKILSNEFHPSTAALKSLLFVKIDELENLIKKGNIPEQFIKVFKIILYMLDIEFDSNLSGEDLINFVISELIVKNNKKPLQYIISDYISKNKDMNLSDEKVEKIENIINSESTIISMKGMNKINRLLSYISLLIKDYHDYIILKKSDGVPYYEIRNKNKNLQELKKKLDIIENNGILPKIEEEKKEIIKEELKEGKMNEANKEETKIIVEEKKEENKEETKEIKEDNNEIIEIKKEDNEKKVELEEKNMEENQEIKREDLKDKSSIPLENQKVEEQAVSTEIKEEGNGN